MGKGFPEERSTTQTQWHRTTRVMVGGLVTASFMFFLLTGLQTPGLDPPPESAALFIVVTTVGMISYLLLDVAGPIGYGASILTGLIALMILIVVGSGVYGEIGPRTNPIGPLFYLVLAFAVIANAGLAWRAASGSEHDTDPSTDSIPE